MSQELVEIDNLQKLSQLFSGITINPININATSLRSNYYVPSCFKELLTENFLISLNEMQKNNYIPKDSFTRIINDISEMQDDPEDLQESYSNLIAELITAFNNQSSSYFYLLQNFL